MSDLRLAKNLAFPTDVITQTLAFLAKRGAGKSYTASVLAEEMLKHHLPIVVIDPTGVWWGLRASADGTSEGYPIVVMGGEHADVPLEVGAGEMVARFIVEENVSVVLDLKNFRKGEAVRFMTPFAETLYHLNRTPRHIFWDECDLHLPQKPGKDQLRLLGAGEDIVRRGRANGLGVSLISQRAAVINKDVLTQTEVLVALRTTGPQDIAAVRAWVEQHDVHDRGDAMLASLPSLPIGESWWWSPGWLDVFARVKVRERTTFNSSRTPKVGERITPPKKMAKVDLERLSAQMKETIERAQADDPKVLKAKIRELQVALGKAKPCGHAGYVSPQEVEARVNRAREEERKRFGLANAGLRNAAQRLVLLAQGEEPSSSASDGGVSLKGWRSSDPSVAVIDPETGAARMKRVGSVSVIPPSQDMVTHTAVTKTRTITLPASPAVITDANGDVLSGSLTGPQQRIIDALGWFESIGVMEPVLTAVAFMAGYSVGGGAFNNPRGQLRAARLVEYRGDGMVLTPAGRQCARTLEVPQTLTGLHDRVLARLPGPEKRILTPLLDAYPEGMTNPDLAEAAGYSQGGGAYNNPKGRLRSCGLVVYTMHGTVRAADCLFPPSLTRV